MRISRTPHLPVRERGIELLKIKTSPKADKQTKGGVKPEAETN